MPINNNTYNPTTYNSTSTPKNYKRGNPIPLDNTALWNSLEDAKAYAKDNATAYVGQIISVVENNKEAAYIITDTQQEDGSYLRPIADLTKIEADLVTLGNGITQIKNTIEATPAPIEAVRANELSSSATDEYQIKYSDDNLTLRAQKDNVNISLNISNSDITFSKQAGDITNVSEIILGVGERHYNDNPTEPAFQEMPNVSTAVVNGQTIYLINKKYITTQTIYDVTGLGNAVIGNGIYQFNTSDSRNIYATRSIDLTVNNPLDSQLAETLYFGSILDEANNKYLLTIDPTQLYALFSLDGYHVFMLYKDTTSTPNRYYLISCGTRATNIQPATWPDLVPAEFKNDIVSYNNKGYKLLENKTKIGLFSDLSSTHSLFDAINGEGNFVTNDSPAAIMASSKYSLFGDDPKTTWVTENKLGLFTYNADSKLNYQNGKYSASRLNPVGNYQLVKVENYGYLYTDTEEAIIVPEIWSRGTRNYLNPQIPEGRQQTEVYTQLVKITRWAKKDDYELVGGIKKWNWQEGKTRYFYRTIIPETRINGSNQVEVRNWSYFHEIITSENFTDHVARSLVNYTTQTDLTNAYNGAISNANSYTDNAIEQNIRAWSWQVKISDDLLVSTNMTNQIGIANVDRCYFTIITFSKTEADFINDKLAHNELQLVFRRIAEGYDKTQATYIKSGFIKTSSGTNGSLSFYFDRISWDNDNNIYKIRDIANPDNNIVEISSIVTKTGQGLAFDKLY
jgi:hypothetical protein